MWTLNRVKNYYTIIEGIDLSQITPEYERTHYRGDSGVSRQAIAVRPFWIQAVERRVNLWYNIRCAEKSNSPERQDRAIENAVQDILWFEKHIGSLE